jgi:hypothetical protein
MKLGWLLFQYAPLDLKLSRAQKREARQRTWRTYQSTPSALLLSLATATFLGLVFAGAIYVLDRVTSNYYNLFGFVTTLVMIGVAWVTNAFVGRWLYGKAHYQALREMGFDVCANCGYWLRGLDDNVRQCPECGAAREPLPGAEATP